MRYKNILWIFTTRSSQKHAHRCAKAAEDGAPKLWDQLLSRQLLNEHTCTRSPPQFCENLTPGISKREDKEVLMSMLSKYSRLTTCFEKECNLRFVVMGDFKWLPKLVKEVWDMSQFYIDTCNIPQTLSIKHYSHVIEFSGWFISSQEMLRIIEQITSDSGIKLFFSFELI